MAKSMSMECVSTGLDLFKTKPVQTSVENGYFVEVRPLSAISQTSPIEFFVKGSVESYLDLSDTHLHIQAQVVREDGSDLQAADDDLVIFEQLAIHTLFSTVDVSLNSVLCSTSSQNYPYRSYLETLLNYDAQTKRSQLALSGVFPHKEGDFNFTTTNNSVALDKRRKRVNRSKVYDLIGKVHTDLSYCEQYMLNGVDVRLRFVRSKDNFVLNACSKDGAPVHPYKIKIIHAGLFVKKLKINPVISLAHSKVLAQNNNARYSIKRVITKCHSVAKGSLFINLESLFSNQIPSRVVVGLVDADAYNGNYRKSCFEFKHYNLTSLAFHVDGVQVPSKAFNPNYDNDTYARSYFSLYQGVNRQFDNHGHGVSYEMYKDGHCLYMVDLTPCQTDDQCVELYKHGSLSLAITLGKPLENPVNVILYSQFDASIQIDRARNVLLDW